MKNKFLAICLVIFTIWNNYVFAQESDFFTHAISHLDCNGLLSGPYTVLEKDIQDFARNEIVDLKIITIEGHIKPGLVSDKSLIIINRRDYNILFPTEQVKNDVKLAVTNFINNFDEGLSEYKDYSFLFTYSKKNVDYMIYFYINEGRLLGYAHPIELGGSFNNCHTNLEYAKSKLIEEIGYARKQNKTMIWYGDEIKLDIKSISDENGSTLYRRVGGFTKPFPRKIEQLENVFQPSLSSVCNAIPKTESQLMKGGFAANKKTIKEWGIYHQDVENVIKPHFTNHLATVKDLKNEFLKGDKNVLVIMAHLTGEELFIGDEKVSLSEIAKWGKRERPSGERIAVLFICNAGNQEYKVGSLLWKKKIEPLSNILIKNNYFDQVIAPNHEIKEKETRDVLNRLLETKSILEMRDVLKGWFPYVLLSNTGESNTAKI